jgi:membrane protein YqaA with SNARE-associated domain
MLISNHDPITCLVIATLGNWLGGITSYGIGYLGKWEWITKYLRISLKKIESTTQFVSGKELWISFFCWLPGIGDVIAVVLGLLKANFYRTFMGMLLGKMARYAVWGYLTLKGMALF